MFWKSKKQEETNPEQTVKLPVSTIPKEFYAGANPVIKFKTVEKSIVEKPAPTVKPVPIVAPKPAVPAPVLPQKKSAAGLFTSRKFLVFGTLVLFVVFIAFAGVYYWIQIKQNSPAKNPPKQEQKKVAETSQQPVVTPVIVPPTTTVVVATTTQTTEVPTSTTSLAGGLIEFPSTLLGTSEDLDKDGLTDAEEELFGSDPAKTDTDGDGYDDKTEVDNLYAPTVMAPARLISTGSVKEYENPKFNYKMYYPSSWVPGNVDPDYRDVLFSTITGDNIEIRVFDRATNQTFDDWFGVWAPGENLGLLKDFRTVFKTAGRVRNDNLVFYFEDDQHFYVLVYHVTGSSVVSYRGVIDMMARSFRVPSALNAVLPEQEVLVPPPAATSP